MDNAASPVEQHEAAPAGDAKLGAFVRRLAVSLADSPKSFLANVQRAIEDLNAQPAPSAPLEGTGNGADEREGS